MHPWWSRYDGLVTLVHGTSSALADKIRGYGLTPPEDVAALAHEVAIDYLGYAPDRDLWRKIYRTAVEPRLSAAATSQTASSGHIFAFPYPAHDRAARYAHSFCEHGGEVPYCVWRILCDEIDPTLRPRFAGAHPVVCYLDVPKESVRANQDLGVLADKVDRLWQKMADDAFASFDDFAADVTDFEVAVDRPIPPACIVDVRALDSDFSAQATLSPSL